MALQQTPPNTAPAIPLPSNFWQRFPSLLPALLCGLIIAVIRFWDLSSPLTWALQGALLILGILLGHLLFIFQPYFGAAAQKMGQTLAENPFTEGLPQMAPSESSSLTDTTPLKQSLILLILPVVGVFLLTSSRFPLGHGFLFGISAVYFFDILRYFRHQPSDFPTQYFPAGRQFPSSLSWLTVWFSLYCVILIAGLLLL